MDTSAAEPIKDTLNHWYFILYVNKITVNYIDALQLHSTFAANQWKQGKLFVKRKEKQVVTLQLTNFEKLRSKNGKHRIFGCQVTVNEF